LVFSIPANFILFALTAWTIPFNAETFKRAENGDETSRGLLFKKNLQYFPVISLVYIGLVFFGISKGGRDKVITCVMMVPLAFNFVLPYFSYVRND